MRIIRLASPSRASPYHVGELVCARRRDAVVPGLKGEGVGEYCATRASAVSARGAHCVRPDELRSVFVNDFAISEGPEGLVWILGLLHTLGSRYAAGEIYTYTGTILIALNPWRSLPLYDAEQARALRRRRAAAARSRRHL